MHPEVPTHALLRIVPADFEPGDSALPPWVRAALGRAPWVVVRRARSRAGLIPVGVRGAGRAERCAAWLRPEAVLQELLPAHLAAHGGWREHARRAAVPALAVLDTVESIMRRAGLASCWGPGGSVGFELASGCATATAHSDADLIVQLDRPLHPARASMLFEELARLAVRADVLLETPHGALALAEYAHGRAPFLLRTRAGPRLQADPWARVGAAA